ALVISVHRAHLSRPRTCDNQAAFARAFDDLAVVVDDGRHHAEEWTRGGPRLEFGSAGQRGDQMPAGLGLPPGVDDRATAVAHHMVVPLPRLGVDGLAYGAEQAQALAAGLLDRFIALAHERADGSRGGVEDVDLVLVDHLPETRGVRIAGHALEHQADGAVSERTVDDVRMTGDPAHVGGAPEDIALV